MITRRDCQKAFRELGLTDYSSVIVHYHPLLREILGQSATFIQALFDVVTEGNVLAFSEFSDNSEPYRMGFDSLDEAEKVRQELLNFDTKRFRDTYYDPLFLALSKTQGRIFSNHPYIVSCVNGPQSRYIARVQPLDFPYGEESVFGAMSELKAKILVIGDDMSDCHELRLGYHHQNAAIQLNGAAGGQGWEHYFDYQYDKMDYQKAISRVHLKGHVMLGNQKMHLIDYNEALRHMDDLAKDSL
ncbi:MAG: AAC(3) family N-acetyltransferase [Erysipelothrix sp.]|nr:AAC(3) family N-acetyltransferase [Erysipelothrix sp.]